MPLLKITGSDRPVIVDLDDYERINRWKWRLGTGGYPVRSAHTYLRYDPTKKRGVDRTKTMMLHYEIMEVRPGFVVDHKNRNKLDNRRSNLRYATLSDNGVNKLSPNRHGYRGVSLNKGHWCASISKNGKKTVRYGLASAEQAAQVYDDLARTQHGEFAMLNFSEAA